MATGRRIRRSDLFLVRLWVEEVSDNGTEWCGKVQRAVSGEARYFRDWAELVDLLLAMFPAGATGRSRQTLTEGTDDKNVSTTSSG